MEKSDIEVEGWKRSGL